MKLFELVEEKTILLEYIKGEFNLSKFLVDVISDTLQEFRIGNSLAVFGYGDKKSRTIIVVNSIHVPFIDESNDFYDIYFPLEVVFKSMIMAANITSGMLSKNNHQEKKVEYWEHNFTNIKKAGINYALGKGNVYEIFSCFAPNISSKKLANLVENSFKDIASMGRWGEEIYIFLVFGYNMFLHEHEQAHVNRKHVYANSALKKIKKSNIERYRKLHLGLEMDADITAFSRLNAYTMQYEVDFRTAMMHAKIEVKTNILDHTAMTSGSISGMISYMIYIMRSFRIFYMKQLADPHHELNLRYYLMLNELRLNNIGHNGVSYIDFTEGLITCSNSMILFTTDKLIVNEKIITANCALPLCCTNEFALTHLLSLHPAYNASYDVLEKAMQWIEKI